MALKKQVEWVLDTEEDNVTLDEIEGVLQHHVEDGNIESDFDIESNDTRVRVHFDVTEAVEHPDRFLFKAFTAYGGTAWHNFD